MRLYPQGDRRPRWVAGERRSTLVLLVSGRFRWPSIPGYATADQQQAPDQS